MKQRLAPLGAIGLLFAFAGAGLAQPGAAPAILPDPKITPREKIIAGESSESREWHLPLPAFRGFAN